MYYSKISIAPRQPLLGRSMDDPRQAMAERLPRFLQPLLTAITAKPAPGEAPRARSPHDFVGQAILFSVSGAATSWLSWETLANGQSIWVDAIAALVLLCALTVTCSGLGLFQVVVFHHCSHWTVFSTRERNRRVGKLVSALLLFKHFELYQREHMTHHNANKLFTDEDEFTDFVVGICALAPASSREALWRRLILDLVSPVFHARFLFKRVRGALFSHDPVHNWVGRAFWTGLLALALATHSIGGFLVAVVLPVTVLLQIATVFRILCEHRFPPQEVIAKRGRQLVCEATAGVFPGVAPPARPASTIGGFAAWCVWWADMLTVQAFVRMFVLVGDAPCHDFHHRRPANKRWTDYAHARQEDQDAGCPGFPVNYVDTWGLLRALDQNFRAMALVPADFLD